MMGIGFISAAVIEDVPCSPRPVQKIGPGFYVDNFLKTSRGDYGEHEKNHMKIEHTAFNVEEPVLMARWYVEHLGLVVKRRTTDSPFAHFLADNSGTVMIEIYGNKEVPLPDYRNMNPGELHLAFLSDDPAADCARLTAAGASIVADTHQLGEDTFVMLRDPWGLPIQLVKRAQPMI